MNQNAAKHFPPEYLNEDISGTLLGTAIAMAVVDTAAIMLLFLSRYFAHGERKNMSMEIFMTIAYLVCMGKIVIVLCMVKIGGAGHHLITLHPETIRTALKLSTGSQIVCPMTTSISKLGVLCFYHRILDKIGRWYKPVIRATFVLCFVIMLIQVLIPFFNCRPFHKTWIPQAQGACAIPTLSLWRYLSLPNTFTTVIVIAIPLPSLIRLQVSRPVKIGLSAVFAVCILGIVASIMRFQTMLEVQDFHDITYENVKPMCWIVAEAGIYLVAGVMPTLRPLVRRLVKNTRFERFLSSGSGHSASFGNRRLGDDRRRFRIWRREERQVDNGHENVHQARSMSNSPTQGIVLVDTRSPAGLSDVKAQKVHREVV